MKKNLLLLTIAGMMPAISSFSSVVLREKSTESSLALIDIELIRETPKAVLAIFLDKDGQKTNRKEWLPKKALTPLNILGQDVLEVVEWFEHIDGGEIDGFLTELGYDCEIKA